MAETLTVTPLAVPFDISLPMPGSKSMCNRAIVMAALSSGTTILKNMNPCDDVKYMVEGINALGWDAKWIDDTTVEVNGIEERKKTDKIDVTEIFCGNAGTAVRFLTALACVVPGHWRITGDKHMQQRPIGHLVSALRELGVEIEASNDCPPITIQGGNITGQRTYLDASQSSQFLTGLLHLGAALPNGLEIELTSELTSPTYIELTKRALADFGVTVEQKGNVFTIASDQIYQAVSEYDVEGDWSGAGSFVCLAELSHSRLRCPNLRSDSQQGDSEVPQVIQTMRSTDELTIDCTNFPDQLMNLCVVAAKREAKTIFTGAANLRHKECDRLAVVTSELQKLGVKITEHDDGVIVEPSPQLQPATLNPCDDHRMAMCFGTIGSLFVGVTIENPTCVSKTYPHFFADLEKLKAHRRCIAIVGMRACGKSNLAKRLAKKLQMDAADTDSYFEHHAGPIRDFVANSGWDKFREGEELAVRECVQPNTVVALGGGAIESAATRKVLDSEATVLWMQSTPELIIKRLQETDRPALTEKSLDEEVRETMARREPWYKEVADLILPVSTPLSKQVETVASLLQDQCTW